MGEDNSQQGNTAWRNGTKRFLEESSRLQKEVAGLQEAMQRAVAGQEPAALEDTDPLQVPGASRISHPAQTGMLLLKVRVFLKTMRELKEKSIACGEQIDALREMFCARHTDRAVADRLQSLAVSRTLLLQLEAEAGVLAAAYAELERALQEAGQAFDAEKESRLLKAAKEARMAVEKTRRSGGDGC